MINFVSTVANKKSCCGTVRKEKELETKLANTNLINEPVNKRKCWSSQKKLQIIKDQLSLYTVTQKLIIT